MSSTNQETVAVYGPEPIYGPERERYKRLA